MPTILDALVPVFLLIVVGQMLRRFDLPGAAFWAPAERLTYTLLFPALLIVNLAQAPLAGQPVGPLALVLVTAVAAMSALLLVVRPFLRLDGPAFTSLFQGGIRFNTYIGLAAASALYGEAGLTLAAITLAMLIPLVNVLCVAVLTRWGRRGAGPWAVVVGIARNPLVLACLIGIGLNLLPLSLPAAATGMLEILGRAALPLGLLAVGAGLDLRALRHAGVAVTVGTVAKLAVMPGVMALAAWAMGLTADATAIVILFAALPGATSAYILARQLGGDHRLMAGLITAQTAAALVTLPLALSLLAGG